MYNVILWPVRATIVAEERQNLILWFSALSHKRQDLWKKIIGNKICDLIIPSTFI